MTKQRHLPRKEQRKYVDALEAAGWRIERRGKHVLAFAPDGETTVSISGSPSDHRANKNMAAKIKREWGVVPGIHS